MVRQKVEILLNVNNMVYIKLIACKSIISQNYTSDLTGECSHLLTQVVWLHVGAKLEAQRYKQRILEVSRGGGG